MRLILQFARERHCFRLHCSFFSVAVAKVAAVTAGALILARDRTLEICARLYLSFVAASFQSSKDTS